MILKSRRAGRLATSKAKCILALEVQLGGQSCVGAENAYRGREGLEGLLVGHSHGGTGGDGSLRKGECVYDDFSFLALGESALWEFTPFTPLALSFFDLLLAGTCFFFKVCAWACSLHRRSWKLINFHIMKA